MPSVYCRDPHLGQNFFVFVSDDDIWRVNMTQSFYKILKTPEVLPAHRLTTTSGLISQPKISPDEKHIAYESTESGERDIYLIPSHGGISERLTFKGDAKLCGWADNQNILVHSGSGEYASRTLYQISTTGHESAEYKYGFGSYMHQNKYGTVVGRKLLDLAFWKGYRGGLVGEIWTRPEGSQSFQKILTDSMGNIGQVVYDDNMIYFISDRDGVGEIYQTDLMGKQVLKIAASK
ncbi:MAG: hypothetical protein OXC40_03530, partial [Proteobacteria bacterium]|nr:hypothetical protein [Pseudomonadota bacterium]